MVISELVAFKGEMVDYIAGVQNHEAQPLLDYTCQDLKTIEGQCTRYHKIHKSTIITWRVQVLKASHV